MLSKGQDIEANRKTEYFLILRAGRRWMPRRVPFEKVFGIDNDKLKEFVKANKLSFKVQADLEKIFWFCAKPKKLMSMQTDYTIIRQYNFPTVIRFGAGAVKELPAHLASAGLSQAPDRHRSHGCEVRILRGNKG